MDPPCPHPEVPRYCDNDFNIIDLQVKEDPSKARVFVNGTLNSSKYALFLTQC